MRNSRNWSSASAPCRLEWRPSPGLAAALRLMGALAAFAVVASECPGPLAAVLVPGILLWAATQARREESRPGCHLVIPAGEGSATVAGDPIEELDVQWRGPAAFLTWRDGGGIRQRLAFLPDQLDSGQRRELRLAMGARVPAPSPRSMAT